MNEIGIFKYPLDDLLSDHNDSKQSRVYVDLLLTYNLSPRLSTIALIKVE